MSFLTCVEHLENVHNLPIDLLAVHWLELSPFLFSYSHHYNIKKDEVHSTYFYERVNRIMKTKSEVLLHFIIHFITPMYNFLRF